MYTPRLLWTGQHGFIQQQDHGQVMGPAARGDERYRYGHYIQDGSISGNFDPTASNLTDLPWPRVGDNGMSRGKGWQNGLVMKISILAGSPWMWSFSSESDIDAAQNTTPGLGTGRMPIVRLDGLSWRDAANLLGAKMLEACCSV